MAHNFKISTHLANVEANASAWRFDGGFLRIYSGSQPENPDAPIESQVMLAELRFASPAMGAAVGGVITATPIIPAIAVVKGRPGWYRAFESDGSTVICDGQVGTSGADLNLGSTEIIAGGEVSVASYTYIRNKG